MAALVSAMGFRESDQYYDGDYEDDRRELVEDNRQRSCRGKLVEVTDKEDMHIDLLRSPFDLKVTRIEVTCGQNLAVIFPGQPMHVSMLLDERNTTAFELLL